MQIQYSGKSWQASIAAALEFLRASSTGDLAQGKRLLILGPGIGATTERDLFAQLHEKSPLLVGKNIQRWEEFVTDSARRAHIEQGQVFRELSPAAEREYLRFILRTLEGQGLLAEWQGKWSEPNFFSELLQLVRELRLAGLQNREEIKRAAIAAEEADRPLWPLLVAYAEGLGDIWSRRHDWASIVNMAKHAAKPPWEAIFILGLPSPSLVEVEFIQSLSQQLSLHFSTDISPSELKENHSTPSSAHRSLQQLLTGLPTAPEWIENSPATDSLDIGKEKYYPLLLAHTPLAEARAAAAYLRTQVQTSNNIWHIIVPKQYWQSISGQEFWRELDSADISEWQKENRSTQALLQRILRQLEIISSDFTLELGCEYAQLIHELNPHKKYHEITKSASSYGIRSGIYSWQKAAKNNPLLADFYSELEFLQKSFPKEATAAIYLDGLQAWFEQIKLASLAQKSYDAPTERAAHIVLAACLRQAAMLAATCTLPLPFSEWLAELREATASLANADLPAVHERLKFYFPQEMVPANAADAVLWLGMDSQLDPAPSRDFFLSESARRKLWEWNLGYYYCEAKSWQDWADLLRSQSAECLLSQSQFSLTGKEKSATWLLSAMKVTIASWPNIGASESPVLLESATYKYIPEKWETVSASFLSEYRKCPFKSLVEKILSVSDGAASPELDISPADRGTILHKAIEIFFREYSGRRLLESGDWHQLVEKCVSRALSEQQLRFFSGGEALLQLFREIACRDLQKFLILEQEYFRAFPELGEPLTELSFRIDISPGLAYKGIIDRIDIDEKNKKFLVVDYKTGQPPSSADVIANRELQIQMYLEEGERKTGFEAVGGYYLTIPDGERKFGLLRKKFNQTTKSEGPTYYKHHGAVGALVDDEKFSLVRSSAREQISEIVKLVRDGEFPAAPDDEKHCERCAVRPVCRIRARAAEPSMPLPLDPDWAQKIRQWSADVSPTTEKQEKAAIVLSAEQEASVTSSDQLVFIEASAGSGKTTVMVEKIARHIKQALAKGEKPENVGERILAITFTDKAAAQLKEKIMQRLQTEFGIDIALRLLRNTSTIHSFAKSLVLDFPTESGAPPLAKIMEEEQAVQLREKVLADLFVQSSSLWQGELRILCEYFSRKQIAELLLDYLAKRSLVEDQLPEWVMQAGGPLAVKYAKSFAALAHLAAAALDAEKYKVASMDFSDIERFACIALKNPKVIQYFQKKFDLILVDEFQDTNSAQRKLVEAIALPELRNLFVVGDAKQSIYRFRAADVSVFQALKQAATQAGSIFNLSINRRSQAHIVDYANLVCERIFPSADIAKPYEASYFPAKANKPAAKPVSIWQLPREEAKVSEQRSREGLAAVQLIQSLVARGRAYSDIAILLRSPVRNRGLLNALADARIPFVLASGDGFYAQQIVLDGIACLRAAADANNRLAALAVYQSPLVQGKNLANWESEIAPLLHDWRARLSQGSATVFLRDIYSLHPWYSVPRWRWQAEKLLAQVEALEQQGLSAREVVAAIAKRAGWQAENSSERETAMPEPATAGAIQVMSVHAAKGLEFPVVILCDLDGRVRPETSKILMRSDIGLAFPLEEEPESKEKADAWKMENVARDVAESKRLLYVALTRAEEEMHCIVTMPKQKENSEGKKTSPQAKDFTWTQTLLDLPEHPSWTLHSFNDLGAVQPNLAPSVVKKSAPAIKPLRFPFTMPQELSVSELSAYRFCAEFHRLKFVQCWDDLVVDRWEKPGKRKPTNISLEEKNIRNMLAQVGIQKKERGIALHRILERLDSAVLAKPEIWAAWLEEAYLSQGALAGNELQKLIAADCKLLSAFIATDLGQKLFADSAKAYPELAFRWRSHSLTIIGSMDRIVEQVDGTWIVADYKTSSREESKDRYFTQVNTYRAALRAVLPEAKKDQVSAWLIDLYTNLSEPVPELNNDLEEVISGIRVNYAAETGKKSQAERKIEAKMECLICPYGLHCAAGQKVVLDS